MASAERGFVLLAFLLIGCVVGYVTFLIFRIAVRQSRFEWSGALAVITSLAGGGFLSYRSQPMNFAAYGLGFFAGFATYWRLLQREDGYVTGSARGYPEAPSRGEPLSLGSQAAASGSSVNEPPPQERGEDLLQEIADNTRSAERRVRALLALHTQRRSEDITTTQSLRGDLFLTNHDLILIQVILRVKLSSHPLNTVQDLIDFVDENA